MTAPDGVRRVTMVTYTDAQALDVTGPLEVFARTARWLREERVVPALPYEVEIVASTPGPVRMSSGIEILAARSYRDVERCDTLLVCGGIGFEAACNDAGLLDFLGVQARRVRRLASVCTGAFVLARAGLLDGRRATTHWQFCDRLAGDHPSVSVDPDAIYVRDGKIYTSAGVTAGIDLALALVEEDWGRAQALAVAQQLVLFLKRPGGQSQFSSALVAARRQQSERFGDLLAWIQAHLHETLTVETLAAQVAMSPRHFARTFVREFDETPAKYVERVRLEAARRELENGSATMDEVARRCGFGTSETLRRTFERHLRVSPNRYRSRFSAAARE